MPSGRARSRRSALPLVFFLDRGLGRHIVADALRAAGYVAHTKPGPYV